MDYLEKYEAEQEARREAIASTAAVGSAALADGKKTDMPETDYPVTIIGCIRELIGNGTIFGLSVMGASYEPMLLMVLAPGGFITFGILIGVVNAITAKIAKKKAAKGGAEA